MWSSHERRIVSDQSMFKLLQTYLLQCMVMFETLMWSSQYRQVTIFTWCCFRHQCDQGLMDMSPRLHDVVSDPSVIKSVQTGHHLYMRLFQAPVWSSQYRQVTIFTWCCFTPQCNQGLMDMSPRLHDVSDPSVIKALRACHHLQRIVYASCHPLIAKTNFIESVPLLQAWLVEITWLVVVMVEAFFLWSGINAG